jgi:RNA polymerase sigma factor (sigma-70 family)
MDRLRLRHRTEKLFGDEMEELDSLASNTASGVHCLIAAEDITALNMAVTKLSDKYRVPLVLVYYNQFSYNEVSKQLNISVSHVGVLVLRAKKQLRATPPKK